LSPELIRLDTPQGRFYKTPEGKIYPSVTTVLGKTTDKSYLDEWRSKVGDEEANKVSSRASRRGTRIHKLAEDQLLGRPLTFNSIHDQITFNSLKKVFPRISNVRHIEHQLYSNILESAGTVDLVADFDFVPAIIDWKTSTRPKYKDEISNYFIQAAAYAFMYWEVYKVPVRWIVIIMAVDNDAPIIFIEKIDPWIQEYRKLRNQFTFNLDQIIINP
jgi:ATP-dependent exoDNAse (exonuclease V) beta subunit